MRSTNRLNQSVAFALSSPALSQHSITYGPMRVRLSQFEDEALAVCEAGKQRTHQYKEFIAIHVAIPLALIEHLAFSHIVCGQLGVRLAHTRIAHRTLGTNPPHSEQRGQRRCRQ